MKHPSSMTRRLLLTILSIVLAAWAAATALSLMVMQDEFAEVFDARIKATAQQILLLSDSHLATSAPLPIQHEKIEDDYLLYRVVNAKGETIYRSSMNDEPFSDARVPGYSDTDNYRIYTAVRTDGTRAIQVADAFKNRREAILEASGALLLPILLLVPTSIFAITYALRRQLKPIATLRDEIAGRHGGNLTEIHGAGLPSELAPIASSVNHLIERVKDTLQAERDFASNSAHELRTPVAGALAQLQHLKSEMPQGYVPRLEKAEQSLRVLTKTVEKLLQLHRSSREAGFERQNINLAMVVRLVAEDFQRQQNILHRLVVEIDEKRPLIRNTNADALGIVLRNLIENALIHSPADHSIRVYAGGDGALIVENDAEPIAPAQLAKLTQRFTRGNSSVRGSGLGLAIAAKLMEQLGGQLVLNSPIPGSHRGFQAKVIL